MIKKVIISEDFSDEYIQEYIDRGFRPHILSKRKIKRSDKKTYNRLKRLRINPASELKFSIVNDDYDFIHISDNPLIDYLSTIGRPLSEYQVLESREVKTMEDAVKSLEFEKNVELKFVKIKTVFSYQLRPEFSGQPTLLPTSRDFCQRMVGLNKSWTLFELQGINSDHLAKMGLPRDVFAFTGGYYRKPGTTDTTAYCRHQWVSSIVIEP
jgi:hypothetical protein